MSTCCGWIVLPNTTRLGRLAILLPLSSGTTLQSDRHRGCELSRLVWLCSQGLLQR
jgi:hypothetical protein